MPDIEEHYDRIYRYCYFKMHHAQTAEDLTQETFLRFLECDSYQDSGRPLAFLYTVARNLCMDELRKKKWEPLSEELLPLCQEGLEESLALQMAMEKLSGRERELILLRYVNEVPYADLCGFYGSSRFALYREVKQVLKKLKSELGEMG